jgi:hypothetical protein
MEFIFISFILELKTRCLVVIETKIKQKQIILGCFMYYLEMGLK